MSKSTVYEIKIQFGDCDPAGIVFFPNYSKWMDAASLHFFMSMGVPPWREYEKQTGILGTPLVEINTKFKRPSTYGETLHIHTSIAEWRAKVFIQKHMVMRGDTLICEGLETRAFVIHPPDAPDTIRAVPIPDSIRLLCS
jgi:4-hydroxybenzoyl-CoA thioesterase